MKRIGLIVLLMGSFLIANNLKEAFSEGLKASMTVIEYEKKQANKAIPNGYCIALLREKPLAVWESVKLESLALVLHYKPSFLEENKGDTVLKNLLCLSIEPNEEKAIEVLKEMKEQYPNLNQYITQIKVVTEKQHMHRAIPGIGKYIKESEKNMMVDTYIKKEKISILQSPEERIVFQTKEKKVVESPIDGVYFIEMKKDKKWHI